MQVEYEEAPTTFSTSDVLPPRAASEPHSDDDEPEEEPEVDEDEEEEEQIG